jgi:hypothetical protein
MDLTKRSHARYPSDLKCEVFTGPVGGVRLGQGVVIDLSLSGCLLRFAGDLKRGSAYRLTVSWKEGALDLPVRMTRDAGRSATDPKARHYGLAFNLTGGQEKSLMRLIDLVRRTEQPGEDRFLRGYWG